jgi:feruloyl esterase
MPISTRLWHGLATATIVAAGLTSTAAQGGGAAPQSPRPTPLAATTTPVRACESLKDVTFDRTTIESAVVDPGDAQTPASCRVTAVVTHPPAGDAVRVFLAFPLTGWNGRFQGVGGGGFSGGSAAAVRAPLQAGYAAGSTDTGHAGGSGSFAVDAANRLQWMLIRDNAYLGIHEMTQTGQALTRSFYGAAPARSYFNGCSTGGRQGFSEAQRYPADYDGILAGAPAINWTKLHIEQMWGHVVMTEAAHVVPACMYTAATTAALAACDGLDGVKDGVIDDPARCTYDPKALVGTTAGTCGTFTEADASVIRRIWDGPHALDGTRLWYGLPRGADFTGLSGTGGTPLVSRPNGITLEWWKYFLFKDPRWEPTGLTRAAYEQAWQQSLEEFSAVIATDNPDLSAFQARGGKIVWWHGQADPLIYPGGSIDYYQRVERAMGGRDRTGAFLRFFLAPGVGHCGGGAGPNPSGQFEAMVKWVEEGAAPDTLSAVRRDQTGAITRTRPLCRYPLVAKYTGTGSTDEAANFACAAGF